MAKSTKRKPANRPARFIGTQNAKGQWHLKVRARGNGKAVGPTEGYTGSPNKVERAFRDMARAVDEARTLPVILIPYKPRRKSGKPRKR